VPRADQIVERTAAHHCPLYESVRACFARAAVTPGGGCRASAFEVCLS
jgi:hypothetical protein